MILVVDTTHIVDVKNLEDVVHTHKPFHIGFVLVHHETGRMSVAHREDEEFSIVRIQVRIVLVGKLSVQHLESYGFTPLQFLEQWDAVEYLSVQVPRDVERCITVVQELHVVDEVERFPLEDVRQVGRRHDEHGEWHLVPLGTSLDVTVNLSPRREPETLVDARFGEVIVIFTAQHSLESGGVRQVNTGASSDTGMRRCLVLMNVSPGA